MREKLFMIHIRFDEILILFVVCRMKGKNGIFPRSVEIAVWKSGWWISLVSGNQLDSSTIHHLSKYSPAYAIIMR